MIDRQQQFPLYSFLEGTERTSMNRLLPKSLNQAAKLDDGAFSVMPGGRPSSFHGVTEWGTRWPRAAARGTARGEALLAKWRAARRSRRASPVR